MPGTNRPFDALNRLTNFGAPLSQISQADTDAVAKYVEECEHDLATLQERHDVMAALLREISDSRNATPFGTAIELNPDGPSRINGGEWMERVEAVLKTIPQ